MSDQSGRTTSCCRCCEGWVRDDPEGHDAALPHTKACLDCGQSGRSLSSTEEATMSGDSHIKIVVTDTHEYHVTIDLNDPRWSHLREDSSNPDEWVAALDEEAQEPDSDLARLVRGMSVTDAWREVTHGD